MGRQISDPEGLETGGTMRGMELLPVTTELQREKVRRQVCGTVDQMKGVFAALSGLCYEGYEIHMGRTEQASDAAVFQSGENENVYGTYVHGIFDSGAIASALVDVLAKKKGIIIDGRTDAEAGICIDYKAFKETQYDKLADAVSAHLNMEEVYGMLREAH